MCNAFTHQLENTQSLFYGVSEYTSASYAVVLTAQSCAQLMVISTQSISRLIKIHIIRALKKKKLLQQYFLDFRHSHTMTKKLHLKIK